MEKLKEFVTKNAMKIILSVIVFGSLWSPSKDIAHYMYNGDTQNMIQHVIAESLKDKLEEARVDYALKLILNEVKDFRKAEEVDREIKKWTDQGWGAQITAIKILKGSKYAKKEIEMAGYLNDEVKITLMSYLE